MRSLFARILLWFLATTAVTVTGLIVTRWLSLNAGPGQQSPFTRMVPFLLVEARHTYETGGRPAPGLLISLSTTVEAAVWPLPVVS